MHTADGNQDRNYTPIGHKLRRSNLEAKKATQILANSPPYLLITFKWQRKSKEGPTKKLYGIWAEMKDEPGRASNYLAWSQSG